MSNARNLASGESRFVNASGDTMTGQLEIQRNATMSLTGFYDSNPSLRLKSSGANSVAGLYLDSEGPNGGRSAGAVHVEPVAADSWRGKLVHTYTADGSIGAYVIRQFHPANSASYDRLTVDASGRVTMPYQPAFLVGMSSGTTSSYSFGEKIAFNQKKFDRSNSFDTTNNRFTAPVTGAYMFAVHLFLTYSGSNARPVIRVNGSDYTVTYDAAQTTFSVSGLTGEIGSNLALLTQLNAGDFVEVFTRHSAGGLSLYTGHCWWSGHLIG